jgi:DNA processing protein
MRLELDHEGIDALLALYQVCAGKLGLLAAKLLDVPAPQEICEYWPPSPHEWRRARRWRHMMESFGIDIVPVWDLPAKMQSLTPVPPALFIRGPRELLSAPAVGIVGARQAARTAETWAFARAHEASAQGKLVVSGGACGVDAAAHRGALHADAPTLAYLGVAADRIYPQSNRPLFERILAAGGALASEHPPSARTYKSDHALRNRFIAAHAERLLIAEARDGSGTLGTAAFARRAGTPVWVSPPGVGSCRDGIDSLLERGLARVLE